MGDKHNESGTLTSEVVGDGWIVDGTPYRTWADRASETAKDRICGSCMIELTEWVCTCGAPEEYMVLRGSRNKIVAGVTRFNEVEDSLVMELAKLGDMLTFKALE